MYDSVTMLRLSFEVRKAQSDCTASARLEGERYYTARSYANDDANRLLLVV